MARMAYAGKPKKVGGELLEPGAECEVSHHVNGDGTVEYLATRGVLSFYGVYGLEEDFWADWKKVG